MSIVTVQLGQCGNQVGYELFDALSGDAELGHRKVFGAASRERFFHQTARGGELPGGRRSAPPTCLPAKASPLPRPRGQSRAGGYGAQSHQAEPQQGKQVGQVALRRGLLLLPEGGFRQQLGQRVGHRPSWGGDAGGHATSSLLTSRCDLPATACSGLATRTRWRTW